MWFRVIYHLFYFLSCKLVLKRAYTAYARGKLPLNGGITSSELRCNRIITLEFEATSSLLEVPLL